MQTLDLFFTALAWVRNTLRIIRLGRHLRLHLYIATLVLGCASCSSALPTHFYTLIYPSSTEGPSSTAAAAPLPSAEKKNAPPAKPAAKFYIEVGAVQIPAQVDRPQFVITTTAGQVEIKEQQRWAAPLQDEIRQVLSDTLMSRLATFDVAQTHLAKDLPIYRVTAKVQRFTSTLASAHLPTSGSASVSVLWHVRLLSASPTQQASALTCHSFATESVKPTYNAIASGHRRALQRIAQEIAAAIHSMATATTSELAPALTCPKAKE